MALNPADFPVQGVDEILERLPKNGLTVSISSKRNSGKSVLSSEIVRALLKAKRVDIVVVMSGSAHLNDDWDFLPKKLVMPFSERILANTWDSQVKKKKEDRKHVLFVFDDCLAEPRAIRNPMLTKIFSTGRHAMLSAILISQHTSVLLSPIIKANSDLICWSKLSKQQLEQLYLSTTNVSKDDFVRISETLGGMNYQFMCLDNYTGSTDPHEFLFVVKAKPPSK